MPDPVDELDPTAAGDAEWFRAPTRREHRIAAGLFVGFGVFFVLLSFVWTGHWFRWVMLGLGVYSVLHGLRHAIDARHAAKGGATDRV